MTDATGFTITVNGSGATIINTSTGSGSYLMIFTPAEPVAEGDTVQSAMLLQPAAMPGIMMIIISNPLIRFL